MERLEELKKSLENMTVEERLAKLAEIRDDRKVSKHATTVRAKREKDKGAALKKKFESLSPEEQAKFLENLNAGETG
tara:strand:- start:1515 stop:1745 length:231 start_codon:yes stop_codon:yes gene_type:complete